MPGTPLLPAQFPIDHVQGISFLSLYPWQKVRHTSNPGQSLFCREGSHLEAGGRKGTNPLLDTLEDKILPEKQITEPLDGLLYFFLEGKHKAKDIELVYRGPAGRLSLQFKDQ